MPDEDGSNSPSRDSQSQPLLPDPRTDLPEQRIVSHDPKPRPEQEEDDSEKPTGRVHWINHATFYLSVLLAILTGGTIRVYWLQLQQMITATNAANDSAYAACMSAKIARQTLLEYQTGEADSHSAAMGTVAQASAAIQSGAAFLALNTGQRYTVPPPGIDSNENDPKNWKKLDLTFNYANIGRSNARNAVIKFTVQILPQGTEPEPTNRKLYFDIVRGVVAPGSLSITIPHVIDKDGKFINLNDVPMDDFHSGKIYVASFGRASYIDVFGISHWQTFCGYFDNAPADAASREIKHPKCGAYNRQDSNLLYPLPQISKATQQPSIMEEIVCIAPKHQN